MALSNPFSTAQKAKTFTDQMADIATRPDSAERLVAYAHLNKEVQSAHANADVRDAAGIATLTLATLMVVAIIVVLPAIPAFSFAHFVVIMSSYAAVLSLPMIPFLSALKPLTTAATNLQKTIDNEVAAASLEDMRRSLQFNAALDAFPVLQERFRKVAERAMLLEAPTPPAPLPLRLTLDKPVHPVPALPTPSAVKP